MILDNASTTIIKVTGYYSGSDSSNTVILNPKTLVFANTSQTPIVDISRVQHCVDLAGAAVVQLYYEGGTSTAIYNYGGSSAGSLDALIPNNATTPTGNIGLQTIGVAAGDTYDFIIQLNKDKDKGFANVYNAYNSTYNYG